MTSAFQKHSQWPRALPGAGLAAALPGALSAAAWREVIGATVPPPDAGITTGLARESGDVLACLRLLRAVEKERGPRAQGEALDIHALPHQALPTSDLICAWRGDVVVGTLTLVRDGVFGLPLQEHLDVAAVRARGGSVGEATALALAADGGSAMGEVALAVFKFALHYASKVHGLRHLLVQACAKDLPVYRDVLGFEVLTAPEAAPLQQRRTDATVAVLDLGRALSGLLARSGKRRRLYDYLSSVPDARMALPDRSYYTVNDNLMSVACFDDVFNRRTGLLGQLTERQRALLAAAYTGLPHRDCIADVASDPSVMAGLRVSPRFALRCPASIRFPEAQSLQEIVLTVFDVSLDGFRAESHLTLPMGQGGQALVELGEGKASRVRAIPVRHLEVSGSNYYGFQVVESDSAWVRCVEGLGGAGTSTLS